MKRRTSTLRQTTEIKADNRSTYSSMVKRPSKINSVFLRKPYEIGGTK